MSEQTTAIFCICDEVVKSLGFSDDPQYKMTIAEVMTFALISALHDNANYRITRLVSISKKQYLFEIKVHMIVDERGIPIEFCFIPGSSSDITGLQMLP